MPDTSQGRTLLLGTLTAGVLAGVTTGASQPVNASQQNQLSVYFIGIGTTSGGTILFEEADWNPDLELPYTGTWSLVTTVNATSITAGAQLAYHTTAPAAFGFVRVRISATITGGGSVAAVLRMR